MKRLLFLLILCPILSYSQSTGIKIGISNSHLRKLDNQTNQYFLSGGLFKNFKLSNKLTLESNIFYTVKGSGFYINSTPLYGADGSIVIPGGKINYWYKFHFIEIPLLLKYNIHRFSIGSGISPSIILYSTVSNEVLATSDRDYAYHDLASKSLDLPILFSIGYKIPVKDKFLLFEIRESYGLFNLYKNYKSNNIFIYTGFSF